MRTTLDLPDAVMRRIKIRAATEGRKLKDMITELLDRGMAAPATETPVGDEPGCIIDPVSGMARARILKATTQRKVSIADSLAAIEEAHSAEDIHRFGLHR